jgi:hypothetical protein
VATLPSLSTYSAPHVQSLPRLEADVRRMLRRAHNPFLLSANPLAQALCETTGIASPKGALESVISGAFSEGFQESRLRDMLLSTVKVSQESKPPEPSSISRRHLQRRRAKAVAILASHIRNVFGAAMIVAVEGEGDAASPRSARCDSRARIQHRARHGFAHLSPRRPTVGGQRESTRYSRTHQEGRRFRRDRSL